MLIRYDRLIITMDDEELEKFCRSWVERKSGYVEVRRYGGPNDKGRDVVGFLSDNKHDGDWDNYQCKQYRRKVDVGQGILAIAKILYWASQKEFSLPKNFFFVAPRGINRNLETLLDKPKDLKEVLLKDWNKYCADKIQKGKTIPLDETLKKTIEKFPFKKIYIISIDEIMADSAVKPLLVELYGADPGKYPPASVPVNIQTKEMPYISALLDAYNERNKSGFSSHTDVLKDKVYGPDLVAQRERFFDADAFQKFYRDNTSPEIIKAFRKDIQFGVKEKWDASATDTLSRIESVMSHAAIVTCGGPLSKYAYVPVKQGICHHFVNDGELTWKKP